MVQRGSIDYYSYLHNHQLGGKIEEDIPWSGMDQTTRYDIFWKDSQILRDFQASTLWQNYEGTTIIF